MKDTTYENLLAMSSFRQSVLPLLTGTGSPGRTKEIEAKLQKYFVATRHTIQAQLLHCSDRRREAVYEYKRALALNPEDRNTKYLMNCAAEAQKMNDFSGGEEFLKNEKYAEAIEEYKKALEMDPHFLFALNSLAIAHYRNGETEKALDAFSHLIKIHPAYVQAYYSLAAIYADQGRFTEAKAELEKALTINPAFEEARTGLEKLEAMISTKKLQEKGY